MPTINLRNVPPDLHRALKVQAAVESMTIKQLVLRLIEDYLEQWGRKTSD